MKSESDTLHWVYAPHAALNRAIADIERRYPPQKPAGLAAFRAILNRFDDPHLRLPPVFHVAGTNGKGSTLAFLQALLESTGHRVHKFTSPHLVRFEERIVLGGSDIASDPLLDIIREIDRRLEDGSVSFFEFFTLAAFILFARHPADAVLLETGLGGLLDATNVIENPAATLLTHISFDHQHILGSRLADIARQKAGIIKPFAPVIVAPHQDPAVVGVFLKVAGDKGAPLVIADIDPSHPLPQMQGAHQVENAATAITAMRQAGFPMDIAQGLKNAHWPGRLQKLESGRLLDHVPGGTEIWLDGAHNDSGSAVLTRHIRDHWGDRPLSVLFALKRGKDLSDIIAPLLPLAADITAIDMPHHDLMMPAASYGFPVRKNVAEAIASLAADTPRRILVTGSLYLVGQALRENQEL